MPEPRWIHGDPKAFADEPPENYLPSHQRRTLEGLADFLDGELAEVEGQFREGTADCQVSDAADKAYEEWKVALGKFRDAVDSLLDETVGDEWNEPDF